MQIQKTVTKTYEVEFFPDAFNCTVGDFIKSRERLGISTQGFKTCFICGRHLSMYRKPIVAIVSGIGSRFVCDACYKKYQWDNGGQNSEKTEL